jgi:hypothetical protein
MTRFGSRRVSGGVVLGGLVAAVPDPFVVSSGLPALQYQALDRSRRATTESPRFPSVFRVP